VTPDEDEVRGAGYDPDARHRWIAPVHPGRSWRAGWAVVGAVGCLVAAACHAGPDRTPIPGAADGWVLYQVADRSVHLVQARPGGAVVNVSDRLAGTGPAALSHNGAWLAVTMADGCAAVSTGGFTELEKVTSHGTCTASYAESLDLSDDGTVLVFNGSGVHERDIFLTRRAGPDDWSPPRNLTGDGQYRYNKLPMLNADATEIVYDCSTGDQSDELVDLCRVPLSAPGGVHTVLAQPIGSGDQAWTSFHSPAYLPGGGYVFECHHPHEELVCVLPPGARQPVRLTTAGVSNDNSPCAFPDGRIASLLDTGIHTVRITRADGSDAFTAQDRADVLDVGIYCGG
jgi:hypothetical protein